jgi:hypothetical protein
LAEHDDGNGRGDDPGILVGAVAGEQGELLGLQAKSRRNG